MSNINPELRAKFENAPFTKYIGVRILDVAEGYARLAVKLEPKHANFLGTPHGALIASLADCALAVACNTYGREYVGIAFNVVFTGTASLEGELFAEARTFHPGRTTNVTEITVTDERGKLIARATGTSLARPAPKQ